MEETVETQLEMVGAIIEIAAEFAIAYGLQIIGALVILFIGLKFAGFVGRRITNSARARSAFTISATAASLSVCVTGYPARVTSGPGRSEQHRLCRPEGGCNRTHERWPGGDPGGTACQLRCWRVRTVMRRPLFQQRSSLMSCGQEDLRYE